MILCMTLLPMAALAATYTPPNYVDIDIYIGKEIGPSEIRMDAGIGYTWGPGSHNFPSGSPLTIFPISSSVYEIRGTPVAGTAGDKYTVDLFNDNINANDQRLKISLNVKPGPQYIIQPDLTRAINSGDFQLNPYSNNENGNKITGLHVPSYTFSGGDPRIATVSSTGLVSMHGVGTTTFNIQSAATGSYTSAPELLMTFTVVDANTNTPTVPQTGDSAHLTGWIITLLACLMGLLGLFIWRKQRL